MAKSDKKEKKNKADTAPAVDVTGDVEDVDMVDASPTKVRLACTIHTRSVGPFDMHSSLLSNQGPNLRFTC